MTPGYKTTEFWLSLIAVIAGFIAASGALPQGGLAAQIVGGVVSVLGLLGYTASRAQVKVADLQAPTDSGATTKPMPKV
jgi:hypothetical protein